MKKRVSQKMNGAERVVRKAQTKSAGLGRPALDAYGKESMKKCDGQVEGRLKHFFSIMRLAASGLATALLPAEATESAEEKPKQGVFMV
ncbi:hypothetical protein [Hymenobacter lucidus]|uniref:Uncharacterized protein n=1 Tax=Hymenobacter lucidus TaxID=2880930 RepID=A0ABS8AP43_9BACT|nr:hypothetical protein [Hymenobacter lucidus]MCB2407963.1 hypothetical protein [Hymenobacter lucidus]